jgi:hypothetical protein
VGENVFPVLDGVRARIDAFEATLTGPELGVRVHA